MRLVPRDNSDLFDFLYPEVQSMLFSFDVLGAKGYFFTCLDIFYFIEMINIIRSKFKLPIEIYI